MGYASDRACTLVRWEMSIEQYASGLQSGIEAKRTANSKQLFWMFFFSL